MKGPGETADPLRRTADGHTIGKRMPKDQQVWLDKRKDHIISLFVSQNRTHDEVASRIAEELKKDPANHPDFVPIK